MRIVFKHFFFENLLNKELFAIVEFLVKTKCLYRSHGMKSGILSRCKSLEPIDFYLVIDYEMGEADHPCCFAKFCNVRCHCPITLKLKVIYHLLLSNLLLSKQLLLLFNQTIMLLPSVIFDSCFFN